MHDWWILLSALYDNTNITFIKLPLIKYRQHSNNVCGYKKINIFILVLRLLFKIPSYIKNVKKAYNQSKQFYSQSLFNYFLNLVIHQLRMNL